VAPLAGRFPVRRRGHLLLTGTWTQTDRMPRKPRPYGFHRSLSDLFETGMATARRQRRAVAQQPPRPGRS